MVKLSYNSSGSQPNPTARSAPRRRASGIMKRRYRNKPVDRILKRRPKKTINKKQNDAIYTLSKQVKRLQFQSFGDRQYQYQYAILQSTATESDSLPLVTRPIFFAANNFFDECPVFRGTVQAVAPFNAGYATAGSPTAITFSKQSFDVDIAEQYQWNEQRNQDTVSKIEYLPEYMKYKFRFMGSIRSGVNAYRYRITFFKFKNLPVTSTKKAFNLPGAGGAYWHLCDDEANSRNYFSKSYHEIIADRWLTINPPVSTTTTAANYTFNKVVEIPIAFKTKTPLKPNIMPLPAQQNFWTNVPQHDIIWCVISSTMTTDIGAPTISMQRVLHWRDKHGTTVGMP